MADYRCFYPLQSGIHLLYYRCYSALGVHYKYTENGSLLAVAVIGRDGMTGTILQRATCGFRPGVSFLE